MAASPSQLCLAQQLISSHPATFDTGSAKYRTHPGALPRERPGQAAPSRGQPRALATASQTREARNLAPVSARQPDLVGRLAESSLARPRALFATGAAMAPDARGSLGPAPADFASTAHAWARPGEQAFAVPSDLAWQQDPPPASSPAPAQAVDELWLQIRAEARADAQAEPALASYLHSSVLAYRSLEPALGAHLANKLGSATLLAPHLATLFRDALTGSAEVQLAVRRDLVAARERDVACTSLLQCFLNFKGFAALQVHRVAHAFWGQGRRGLALALQSRASEVFHVDIHPGAKIGSGVLLDHATGLVIGETAEVGNDVTMLHNVTLGGSGVARGLRHPKVCSGVVLGTGARVLGPVIVGRNASVGAGSLVLSDVAEGTTVVGSPAREVQRKDVAELFVPDYVI